MLYFYPIAATRDNWVHVSICLALRTIHRCIASDAPIPGWPDTLPAKYRARLRRKRNLPTLLAAYSGVYRNLDSEEQRHVRIALLSQNRVRRLLSGAADCPQVSNLPSAIQAPISELFDEGFKLLTKVGLRDAHYTKIYAALDHKVCPFCGLEGLDAPGAPREDLDHYLPRALYPFCGANLRNLAPIGGRCNSSYKRGNDVLWDGTQRRKSFDPYGSVSTSISLLNSTPFGGSEPDLPSWRVDFDPPSEEANTWAEVFSIKSRYVESVLDPSYESWLEDFRTACKAYGLRPSSPPELLDALQRYRDSKEGEGLSDRAFLKVAVFDMLILKCQDGDTELISTLMVISKI